MMKTVAIRQPLWYNDYVLHIFGEEECAENFQ